jgi:hypothetical protein
VFKILRLDKKNTAIILGLALHAIDNLPSSRHVLASVIYSTVLFSTWIFPLRDRKQILVLTTDGLINCLRQPGLLRNA